MANVFTYGIAPKWGIKSATTAFLINSLSTTPNVSEYLTKGGAGQTIGWLAYDQWIDWTMQAVLISDGNALPKFAAMYTPTALKAHNNFFYGGTTDEPTRDFSICKTVATTQTAGDAYQLTLSGTMYPWIVQPLPENLSNGMWDPSVREGGCASVGTVIAP